jgi:hypothetical protein
MRYPKVLQTFPVSVSVGDVVLPGDGYAYVVPAGTGDAAFHVIDLATGAESVQAPLLAGSIARLNPSAGVTYVTNAATPSRVDKYVTRSGSASLLYSSATDRSFGGNLWMSADGTRFFAASGDIYASSSDPAQDMRWLAELPNVPDGVGALADVGGTSPRVLVAPALAPGAITSEVRAYDPATLTLLGSAPLPRVIATDAAGLNHSYATAPVYLLADSNSGATTAVVRAPAALGLAHPWVVSFAGPWTWVSSQPARQSR